MISKSVTIKAQQRTTKCALSKYFLDVVYNHTNIYLFVWKQKYQMLIASF